MRIEKTKKIPLQALFLLTVFVFIMLDTKIAFPFKTILRWVLPMVLLLAVLGIRKGKMCLPSNITYWALVGIFGIAVMISQQRMYSMQRWVSFLLITLTYTNYFLFLKEQKALYKSADMFGYLYLAYGLVNFLFLQWGSDRASGITGNANSLGHFANISFVFAVFYYKKAEGKRRKWLIAAMVASAICVVLSASRSATVVLIADIVVALWLIGSKRFRVLAAVFAPIVIFMVISGNVLEKLPGIDRLLKEDAALGTREVMWAHGINLIKQRPWLGWGYGISQSLNIEQLSFHNSYITVGVESGILGLAVLILLILTALVKGVMSYVQKRRIETLIFLVLACNKIVDFIGESSMTSLGSAEGFFFWGVLIWLLVESGEKADQATKLKEEQRISV